MIVRRLLALALLLAAGLAGSVLISQTLRRQSEFPHAEHARLFPLCVGCHEGVPTGDRAEFYPDPATCAGCHDGVREARVEWAGPQPVNTNLRFSHPEHDARVAGGQVACVQCHTEDGSRRSEVKLAVADQCFACHEAHPARDHFVDAVCTDCHVPIAQTRFALDRVRALPVPATHHDPMFLAEVHGELAEREPARCATCHTRELCTSCHVDVPRVAAIGQIPRAGADLELPRFAASYPVPPSHLDPAWEVRHGRATDDPAQCSTCHTRNGCESCHSEQGTRAARFIAQLPSAARVEAPGVVLARRAPESHASPWFAMKHGEVAATRRETCASCHATQRFCTDCHAPVTAAALPGAVPGERRPEVLALVRGQRREPVAPALAQARAGTASADSALRRLAAAQVHVPAEAAARAATPARTVRRGVEFHPPGFTTNHSAAAYGRRLDCAQCHDQRTFCRDCHTESGFQARGRLGQGFHDAEPVWLLRHGQAARQTLESCTTCHAQRDCMQCHAQLGAFRVNPHRTDFDARRAQKRNPAICFACHLNDPLVRSAP
jgi:hypothetical protein